MTNTQTVRIDLTSPGGFAPVIHAVAGDIYSRFVRMELYQGGVLYEPPSGTTCVIGWRRGETYGAYSSILEEDGSSSHPAWELENNVLTIELDWHVCQHPGDVAVNVSLNGEGGSRLGRHVLRGAGTDADDVDAAGNSRAQRVSWVRASRASTSTCVSRASARMSWSRIRLESRVARPASSCARPEWWAPERSMLPSRESRKCNMVSRPPRWAACFFHSAKTSPSSGNCSSTTESDTIRP